jgi:plastocyanin
MTTGARGSRGRRSPRSAGALVTAVLALALALTAVGCGRGSLTSDTATSSVTPQPVTAPPVLATSITIQSFAFGAPITVSPGQVLTIVNSDPAPHTVTADDGHSFDTPVSPGGRATMTAPSAAGRYPFSCVVHPTMHGMLIVR